jgi:hypothetical protein
VVEKKKTGKPLSPDTEKVRNHLKSLSPEALSALTAKDYRKRTHHHVRDAIFSMEKNRAKKALGLPMRVTKRTPKPPAPTVSVPLKVPYGGRTFDIIATVPLEEYKEVNVQILKKFAAAVLTQAFGANGEGVEILLLSDPPTIELRRRVP